MAELDIRPTLLDRSGGGIIRIAFVCDWDAADPHAKSGAAYSIRQAFLRAGHSVTDVFPVNRHPLARIVRGFGGIMQKLYARGGQFYSMEREAVYRSLTASIVHRRLAKTEAVDAIFSQSSVPVTRLKSEAPIYIASDQTFAATVRDYLRNAAPGFLSAGNDQTRECLDNVAGVFVPSQWAADEFVACHGAAPSKIVVCPWGANLPTAPTATATAEAAKARMDEFDRSGILRLTLIGGDWVRKGGKIVDETVRILIGRGVDVRLTIVGVSGNPEIAAPHERIGFLDKHEPVQFARLSALFSNCHFFFMPSRAEAYGHVYCEAAAFGVPSVATDVGGVSAIVRHGRNGICLPLQASAAEYADQIIRAVSDRTGYLALSGQARTDYEVSLNWDAFAARVIDRIEQDRRADG